MELHLTSSNLWFQDPKLAFNIWSDLEEASARVNSNDFTILRNHFLMNVKVDLSVPSWFLQANVCNFNSSCSVDPPPPNIPPSPLHATRTPKNWPCNVAPFRLLSFILFWFVLGKTWVPAEIFLKMGKMEAKLLEKIFRLGSLISPSNIKPFP